MAHFAELESNIVVRVIVADQAFIDSGEVGDPSHWIRTFHDGSARKNFAGVGYTYDLNRDAFIPPKPFPSWTLDEDTCQWAAPTPAPQGLYQWDENTQDWVAIEGAP
jgi:hypothetical protein